MAKLKLPSSNKAGVGYGGTFYPAEEGYVTVPDEAAAELLSHGLTAESEDEAEKG